MSRALVILDTESQRRKAADWCWKLKHGTRVEFKQPKRSEDQNAKMWAMLSEIATQVKHHDLKLTADDWKLVFLDALKREVRIVPNLDGNGIVSLGRSSSDLSKEEFGDLIELIYEYGARNGVKFKDTPVDDGTGHGSGETSRAAASDQPVDDDAGTPRPVQSSTVGRGEESSTGDGTTATTNQPSRDDCLAAFLMTATDPALTVIEKRDLLEQMKGWWKESMSADLDFVRNCLLTADRVAKGTMTETEAREYLGALT